MAHNLDLLFPGMEIDGCEFFRVTRNANTERDEEDADDLVSMIEAELRERKFAPIVRLEVGAGIDPVHRGMLAAELGLDESQDVFESQRAARPARPVRDRGARPARAARSAAPSGHQRRCSRTAATSSTSSATTGPILLQHPYESFATSVERFVARGEPRSQGAARSR